MGHGGTWYATKAPWAQHMSVYQLAEQITDDIGEDSTRLGVVCKN